MSAQVKVYYLGPDKTGLSDARRLILQILAPQTPNGSIVQCFPLIKPLAIDKVPVEASFALPLQEKYLPWYRLKKPIHARLGSSTSLPKERSPLEDENRRMMSLVVKHTKNQLSKAWAHLPPITQNETKHENWSSDVSKSLSASLGYVMHSGELETKSFLNAPENDGYSSPWNKSARETFSWRSRSARTIFTSVPGLERVLELGIGTPSVANMLMIQLRPVKMKNGPKRLELSRVPWLEVLVDVDNKTRTLQVQSARLVRDWRVADLLLPDKARDIRFQSRSTITSTEHLDDGIQRFVDKSKLDVWGNDRLMTPARLNVTVPLFSCRVLPGNAAKEIVKQEGQGSVEVDYLFSKLEHWSTLRVKLNEYELNYATVEGGQSGGRREELTLETAGWTRTGVSGDDEGEFQKFFRQARRLAAITPRGSTPSNTYN